MLRRVRQRCGFGCVICGAPIYDVDHIEDFADVQVHEESNLTLLCTAHHREKTNGLLPVDAVRAANANPYNVNTGATSPYRLHFGPQPIEFWLGSVRFISMPGADQFIAIMIDDQPTLAFQELDGDFGLTLIDYDAYNYPILMIQNNTMRVGVNSWDATFIGQELKIRAGSGDIKIAIRFEPPNRVVIRRAKLRRNGVEIDVHPDYMTINGFILGQLTLQAPQVGIRIGPQIYNAPTDSIYLAVDRYNSANNTQFGFGQGDPMMRPWLEGNADWS